MLSTKLCMIHFFCQALLVKVKGSWSFHCMIHLPHVLFSWQNHIYMDMDWCEHMAQLVCFIRDLLDWCRGCNSVTSSLESENMIHLKIQKGTFVDLLSKFDHWTVKIHYFHSDYKRLAIISFYLFICTKCSCFVVFAVKWEMVLLAW